MAGWWYETKTTPIDVLSALAVNFGGSYMAAENPSLRWIPFGTTDNLFLDGRVLGGLASIGVAMMGPPVARRAAVDIAQGLLGSVVATEQVRRASIAKAEQQATAAPQQWGTPAPAAAPAALPQPPPAVNPAAQAAAAQAARTSGYPGSYA